MKYTMHCPVEDCDHVMEAEAENDDEAVKQLMGSGDKHFADADHSMDQPMTPEDKEKMTREHMQKEDQPLFPECHFGLTNQPKEGFNYSVDLFAPFIGLFC